MAQEPVPEVAGVVPLEMGVRPALRPVSQASYQEQPSLEVVAVLLAVRVEQEPFLVASRFCVETDVVVTTPFFLVFLVFLVFLAC